MNKVVTVLKLEKEKDQYGSEKTVWKSVLEIKAAVFGFDKDSFFTVNSENIISDKLQFIFRGYIKKYIGKDPMLFRIKYCCKTYRILNVNAEIDGQVSVFTELVNE